MTQGIINCDNPYFANVVLVGAGYDRTSSGGKGADKGPQAIRWALDTQIELDHTGTCYNPAEITRVAYCDVSENINLLEPFDAAIRVGKIFFTHVANSFVITLGGEHTITTDIAKIVGRIYHPEKITFLQIDAHFDLRDTDADYNEKPFGKYAHSTVMRRVSERGFPVVAFGIRSYSLEELEYANKAGIRYMLWNTAGMNRVSPYEIIQRIPTEQVYLTIDIDGINPADMPSTGTPVPGGPRYEFIQNLIALLFQHRTVVAADIVEVAPQSFETPETAPHTLTENDRRTVVGAAQLVYDMIACKFRERTKNLLSHSKV